MMGSRRSYVRLGSLSPINEVTMRCKKSGSGCVLRVSPRNFLVCFKVKRVMRRTNVSVLDVSEPPPPGPTFLASLRRATSILVNSLPVTLSFSTRGF